MSGAVVLVAVALDGPRPPAWQRRAVERIAASPQLELVEVRLVGRRREKRRWRWHRDAERRLFRMGADALAPGDAPGAEAEGEPELLVWLAEGERPPAGGTVLWLAHGPGQEAGEVPFRRAVADGAPYVETDVLLRVGDEAPVVVEHTFSAVRPFSATLTATLALWRAAELPVRAAERLPGLGEPAGDPAPVGRAPGAGFLARSVARWARAFMTAALFRRPWTVLVRPGGSELGVPWGRDGGLVRWSRGHLYADPVLFEHEGRHHLFVEEIPAGSRRGVLSHVELREGGPAATPEVVLERDHHLSYPFVFAHDGEVFLVPETGAANRVELYRAVDFPHRWEPDSVLLEGVRAVDATLFEHDGRWWLFASEAAPGASLLDEVHLYMAPSPRGPWVPHPRNPVVSDVRGSRPAGPVMRDGERLVRPAQDGSRRYGWAVSFRLIDRLTPFDYAEHEIARLEPDAVRGARAVHAYTRDSRFEAIDARRRRLRVSAWFRGRSAAPPGPGPG